MDCSEVAGVLVAYHFATAHDDEREAVDAHLVTCAPCLKTYLALKRAADTGAELRPSPRARARLREEVARSFGKAVEEQPRFFARRVPLYQAVFAAAAAALVAIAAPRVLSKTSVSGGGPSAGAYVDTSRSIAESQHIY